MSSAESDVVGDAIETLYARGVTDGLPVVPPTRERVARAVEASGRTGDELIVLVPPNYGRATAEKIAVNAVMAGCRPEYLPVVIAAVAAVCDEAFDLHGVSATTNSPAPLVIVNGPVRQALDVNCGAGVFGSGWRANATIGRALRLVCVNVGGARPGVVSMSTLAHPGRYTYCIGEYEEANPWESLAVEHGFAVEDSTVAVLAAEAPLSVYDHRSRTAHDLLTTIAASFAVISNHKSTHWGDGHGHLVRVRERGARPGERARRHGLPYGRGGPSHPAAHRRRGAAACRQGVRRDPAPSDGVSARRASPVR